jgi:Xaa-Pro aminopeptidase
VNPRLKKFVAEFEQQKIDAYLVTCETNITYLTQFNSSESWLLVFPNQIFYITDARYTLEAQQGLKGITVAEYNKSMMPKVFELMNQMKAHTLGFDARHMSLAKFRDMEKHCPADIKLVATPDTTENLRMIKEKGEVDLIRQALKLHHKAYAYLKTVVKPGVTEKQVLAKLENYVKKAGAGFSFPPIIASGPNSCYPHARVSDRKIKNNEPVLLDIGIDILGYKSDLTRMFFLGKIPPLVKEVNDFVAESQQRAIKKIKPGIPAADVDYEARNFLEQHQLAKYFGHSLGHGVGLEIHESPRIAQTNSTILKEGMVFTVEPAVYLPNQFGIRIEDMVLVTAKGCEVLSR